MLRCCRSSFVGEKSRMAARQFERAPFGSFGPGDRRKCPKIRAKIRSVTDRKCQRVCAGASVSQI
jgi:hypothetical protein